ncbi:response regulator [Candidatus Riflebacteria bacterium]
MQPTHIRHISSGDKTVIQRIMVYEDDEAMQDLYLSVLTRAGFHVIVKSNCIGGIEDIKWDQPHALILDIMMPGMDGITFMEKILRQETLKALPILIISDLVVDYMDSERCPNNVHLLTKPFKNNELVDKITKLIETDYIPRKKRVDELEEIKQIVKTGPKTTKEKITRLPSKIMIFEDDPDQAELYLAILGKRGYLTLLKTNPVGGMEEIKVNSPDLIIMDIMMPEMTGMQFLAQIKEEEFIKSIPILMISSLLQNWMEEGGAEMPDNVYLMKKPIKKEELLAKVHDLIELYSEKRP